jgi:hypothetical protein
MRYPIPSATIGARCASRTHIVVPHLRTLDKDLALSSTYDANPPNTIVLDQFEDNYQHNPGK